MIASAWCGSLRPLSPIGLAVIGLHAVAHGGGIALGHTTPPAAVDPANPLLVDNRQPPFGTPQWLDQPHNARSWPTATRPTATGPARRATRHRKADTAGDRRPQADHDRRERPDRRHRLLQRDRDRRHRWTPAGVLCTPSAGSVFAIGGTLVGCVSTDAAGNTASASFTVTVLGAKEQLSNLIRKVVDSSNLPAAVKTQLITSLHSLVAGFDPSKTLQRTIACPTLRAFTTLILYTAPRAQRAEWTADSNRIRAVLA